MRIITGSAKGLILKSPKGWETRPTSDRIKESLFSVLNVMIDFEDKTVLDLFAGTGALGLETLSRGAANAVFIDKATAAVIKDNAARAHFENSVEIISSDVFKIIDKFARQERQFDLIFCDPPYNKGLWERALNQIDEKNLLSGDGILIIEKGADELEVPKLINLESIRQIKYGHTTSIEIFRRNNEKGNLHGQF